MTSPTPSPPASTAPSPATPCHLVLGGRGFVGSHLVAGLSAAGFAVRSFDRAPLPAAATTAESEAARVEHLVGDATTAEDLYRATEGVDVCFHLLSSTIPQTSNERPVEDATSAILGSLAIFDACRRAGVRKIIYLSSGGTVYGRARYLPIDEGHPTDPLCAYGISRLAVEKYLHLQHALYGMDYCILRASNLYGPGQRLEAAQGAVGVFLGRMLHGRPIDMWGDGSVIRDYLHVDDLVRALIAAVEPQGKSRLFNVGCGVGHSLNDLLAALTDIVGKTPLVDRHPGRDFDVPANVLDIRAAAAGLAWEPRIDLSTGLQMTWAHLLKASPLAAGEPRRVG